MFSLCFSFKGIFLEANDPVKMHNPRSFMFFGNFLETCDRRFCRGLGDNYNQIYGKNTMILDVFLTKHPKWRLTNAVKNLFNFNNYKSQFARTQFHFKSEQFVVIHFNYFCVQGVQFHHKSNNFLRIGTSYRFKMKQESIKDLFESSK